MTANDYILIFGRSSDSQITSVLPKLDQRKIKYLFVSDDECKNFSVRIDKIGKLHITSNSTRYPMPALVWSRMKLFSLLGAWTPRTIPEYVRRAEWNGFHTGLTHYFSDRVLNSIQDIWVADSKFVQFKWATQAGFQIPQSNFCVGKDHAISTLKDFGNTIAKAISVRNVPRLDGDDVDSYDVYTAMQVDTSLLECTTEDELSLTPIFFQERLMSGTEMRVIAFRDRAFTYKIRQKVEDRIPSRPDERALLAGEVLGRKLYGAHYSYINTSEVVRAFTSKYLKLANLEYGAFDIIEQDGTFYFLECNPEGQWYAAINFNWDELFEHFASVLEKRFDTNRKREYRERLAS